MKVHFEEKTYESYFNPKSDMPFKVPEISACFGVLKAIFLQFLLTTINSRVSWLGIKGNLV